MEKPPKVEPYPDIFIVERSVLSGLWCWLRRRR